MFENTIAGHGPAFLYSLGYWGIIAVFIMVFIVGAAMGILAKTQVDDTDNSDVNEQINMLNAQNKLAARMLTDVLTTIDEQQGKNRPMPAYAMQISQALQTLIPSDMQRAALREEEQQRRKQLPRA